MQVTDALKTLNARIYTLSTLATALIPPDKEK
jgi:hypothetical protein